MRRGKRIIRWLGTVCLAACGLLAAGLAWPSPRARVELELSGEQAQTGWTSLPRAAASNESSPVPDLLLAIDLPDSVLKGRGERVELAVDVSSHSAPLPIYTLAAELIAVDTSVTPAGESAQALRASTAFGWDLIGRHAPIVSATILVRLRRHAAGGVAEAERLLLARELVLPVRTLAGLSANGATRAAAILGLVGVMLWVAATLPRRG
jgi:hypothetical protein